MYEEALAIEFALLLASRLCGKSHYRCFIAIIKLANTDSIS